MLFFPEEPFCHGQVAYHRGEKPHDAVASTWPLGSAPRGEVLGGAASRAALPQLAIPLLVLRFPHCGEGTVLLTSASLAGDITSIKDLPLRLFFKQL